MNKRVFVAGHNGMVGSALLRRLQQDEHIEVVTRSRNDLDLCDQQAVGAFFAKESIDQVYLAAARVGGIYANDHYPANFIYENLMIQSNVIHAAFQNDVSQLLLLGSSCIYPKLASQPMREEELLTGPLEATNEPYAIAKIAGIKICESYNRQYGVDYRAVMPTNLYGPQDNFHPDNGHVIPAMLRRFHLAAQNDLPQVSVWGTGTPKREFLYVDDMAEACVFVMQLPKTKLMSEVSPRLSHLNLGTGEDHSIAELAQTMAKVVGYHGEIVFDKTKPDGTPRKLLDVGRIHNLGWRAKIDLSEGLQKTYQWFLANETSLRGVK